MSATYIKGKRLSKPGPLRYARASYFMKISGGYNMQGKTFIWMFPGQGSQQAGMGRDLAEAFPEFKATIQEASDALNIDMARLCFEDPEKQLALTEFTQPAILTVSTGIWRVLKKHVHEAKWVAGHSLGEYGALVATGALHFSDAVKAVRFRGQSMQQAVPVGVGAMAAYIGAKADEVLAWCVAASKADCLIEVVNFNSPQQLVLSGHKAAVDAACAHIAAQKWGRAIPLAVSAPFHSTLMQPAAEKMAGYLNNVTLGSLTGTLIANVDALPYTGSQYTKQQLIKQIASPVLWTQTLQHINEKAGDQLTWVEVGPGSVLQGLVKKTIGVPAIVAGTNDVASIEALLKELT